MADSTYGFHFRYRKSGGVPTILDLPCKDSETLTKGDLVNLESGELDLAATGAAWAPAGAGWTLTTTGSVSRMASLRRPVLVMTMRAGSIICSPAAVGKSERAMRGKVRAMRGTRRKRSSTW